MIEILRQATKKAGGVAKLARLIGIRHNAFYVWKRIPAERVLDIERATGITRHDLRPDLYPPYRDGTPDFCGQSERLDERQQRSERLDERQKKSVRSDERKQETRLPGKQCPSAWCQTNNKKLKQQAGTGTKAVQRHTTQDYAGQHNATQHHVPQPQQLPAFPLEAGAGFFAFACPVVGLPVSACPKAEVETETKGGKACCALSRKLKGKAP